MERKETSSTRWTKAKRDAISETTLTIKDLIEGKEYEFRVAAVNKAGTGPFSEPSEPRITKPPYGEFKAQVNGAAVFSVRFRVKYLLHHYH